MYYSKNIQDYFDRIDDIIFSKSLPKREKSRGTELIKKDFLKNFSKEDSDYYYFLGYVGYLSKEFNSETESFFRKSLEIRPNNPFCQYYYGFYLFDSRRYDEAITLFKNIDLIVFYELGQIWRYFKIKEIVLCCKLFLPEYSVKDKIKNLKEFLQKYREFIKNDEEYINNTINYPLDLIKCISELISSLSEGFKPVITDFVKLIEELELGSAYSFEYNQFKDFLKSN